MATTTLDVRPVTGALGAEVRGVALGHPLDGDAVHAIRDAWLEHLVLFFPDQHLTPEAQRAFAAQFGELTAAHPVEAALADDPEVLPVDSAGGGRTDFWHSDVTFVTRPPMASVLSAVTLPPAGGDTMWTNMRLAYDTLAEPLRRLCDGLTAFHFVPEFAAAVARGEGKVWEGEQVETMVPVEHPVVRQHPETGRNALFVSPGFTTAIQGFPARQSADLLRLLFRHSTQPEFICRYHWEPGSVAFWDNRATMHYGVHDYGSARRVMHRVTLRGDTPRGPAAASDVPALARA